MTESDRLVPQNLPRPVAWMDDRMVPLEQLSVPAWDLGFAQGVSVCENLRTVGGRVWKLEQHQQRLELGLRIAGIRLPFSMEQLADCIGEVARENRRWLHPDDDLSIHVSVTGGDHRVAAPQAWGLGKSGKNQQPRVLIHAVPIPFARWRSAADDGLRLQPVPTMEYPDTVMPRELKSRSRMHYWLATRQAESAHAKSLPLLAGHDGAVADTATGSIAVVDAKQKTVRLVRPDQALGGTTLMALQPVIEAAGFRVLRDKIEFRELESADEVLWFSTPPILLPVTGVGEVRIGTGRPGPVFERLAQQLIRSLGMDWMAQIRKFSALPLADRVPGTIPNR